MPYVLIIFKLFFFQPRRNALGGPYLAIHFRRQDFIIGRPELTVEDAALQIKKHLEIMNLSSVFVATDTEEEGICTFSIYLKQLILTK